MKDQLTFEQALQRVEEIVSTLERGNIPLEEAITLYEEGKRLLEFCRKKLEAAELKVKELIKDKEGYKLRDLK
ncbi:exodeoxyribonuclease VII small subunit [candidate division WOR-3 bacterium]|nr:exodeoxyribonuclease VII small subunit [candidate division WOR-3 bacterium]